MFREKTIRSPYHYPMRSLYRNLSAYILLAASIMCMVVLCAGVLIYYASRYEAELETMRRTDGPHHTVFYDVDPLLTPSYTNRDYIKDAQVVDVYAAADNPDTNATLSQVYFTEYTEDAADYFYLRLTKGRLPAAFGEILVSEDTLRYFPGFALDETREVRIFVQGKHFSVPFTVVGVFSAASAANEYVFCGSETAAYLRGDDMMQESVYTQDIYLIFEGSQRVAYKRNIRKLIEDLALTNTDENGASVEYSYTERHDMLTSHALARPFYEQETVQLMFLFSILPAAIALTVFIYLDMQKNMGELATLSTIGATPRQMFKMQMLKYAIVFLVSFPPGVLAASLLMRGVCALTDTISPDRVFLSYRFEWWTVLFLFLVCAAILVGVVYCISKKMTAVTYSAMLSSVHARNNPFVAGTSDILFGEGKMLGRISLLFFARNRKVNRLFCLVIVLLVCIYSFFTVQMVKEYGAAPDAEVVNAVDFYLQGDTDASPIYDSMQDTLTEKLAAIPHVADIQRTLSVTDYYYSIDEVTPVANIQKQIVSNQVIGGEFGQGSNRVWKRRETDVRLLGMDPTTLSLTYGADLVEGSLESIYENEKTVALVVHGWARGKEKFYHPGDPLAMHVEWIEKVEKDDGDIKRISHETEPVTYTVGAIIYRPDDDAYEDIVTVCVTPSLFTEITGISDISRYALRCDADDRETLSAVRESLRPMETEYHFTVTDTHEELRLAKEAAMHTVLYVYIMKFFVLLVTALLLIAMSRFILEVRAPAMRAMYLIGADAGQLGFVNICEFLIASLASSLAGVVLSLIGGAILTYTFDIALYATPVTLLLVILSLLLLTAINTLIPVLLCRAQMQKGKLLRADTGPKPSKKQKKAPTDSTSERKV